MFWLSCKHVQTYWRIFTALRVLACCVYLQETVSMHKYPERSGMN